MFGEDKLFTALNVAAIQAKVDALTSGYAIWSDLLIPQDFTGTKSINFYMSSRLPESEVDMYNYTINCRAETMNEAMDISNTIISTVSRKSYTDCFIYMTQMAIIPPIDDTDSYNSVIEAIIKLRS
ncbi:MAG: hypothetical protein PHE51_04930 [Eubacteriales bacterium]|nr:hypothetical protein [Eubacteriales bacterium]